MITYDPKSWLKTSLAFKATAIPRVMGRVGVLAALTAGLLAIRELVPESEPLFKPLKPLGHTLIGVALGLLIVFRNNCSYDRYWEGRKLWGGIVNASRNLLRGAGIAVGDVKGLADMVAAYALALKQHLRGEKDLAEIEALLPPDVYGSLAGASNPPSLIAFHISAWIRARADEGKLDSVKAQSLEDHVRTFLDNQGGCERILRTPIPYVYAAHIKQLLTLYLVTLPVILVGEMSWFAVPTVAAIAFGLLGIEEAGVEIEDPFGDDPNDLPVEAICATIGRDTAALAEASARRSAVAPTTAPADL